MKMQIWSAGPLLSRWPIYNHSYAVELFHHFEILQESFKYQEVCVFEGFGHMWWKRFGDSVTTVP